MDTILVSDNIVHFYSRSHMFLFAGSYVFDKIIVFVQKADDRWVCTLKDLPVILLGASLNIRTYMLCFFVQEEKHMTVLPGHAHSLRSPTSGPEIGTLMIICSLQAI